MGSNAAARGCRLLAILLLACLCACKSAEERVELHMSKATAFLAEGRDKDAIIELRAALSVDPLLAAAHFELAKAYLRTNNAPAAFWELQEVVRLDPENEEARRNLGALALATGDFEEALKQADESIARDYSAGDAYLIRAQALEKLKRMDEAGSAYRAALDVRPEDSGYVLILSGFHERTGEYEKAEELLQKVVEMEASYEAHLALAIFLQQRDGRKEDALKALHQSLELARENQKHLVYAEIARYYNALKEYDKLVETLEEGIEKARKSEPLILQLTRFYRSRNENAKADALIQQVTENRRAGNPDPHLTLASYRRDRGDLDGALAAANAALDADPEHARSKLRKAEILIEMGWEDEPGRVQEAEDLVNEVLAETPESTGALFVRAKIEIARGELQTAVATLRQTLVLRPKWTVAHMVLGSTLFDIGDYQAARAALARAIELDAGLLDARFLITRVHSALGEHEYAIEQARVYLRVYRNHVPTRLLLSESLAALGRRDDAARELEAIPEQERTAEVYYSLGRLAQLRGNREEAKKYLVEADQREPNHAAILQALMDVEVGGGETDTALVRISAAFEAEPKSAALALLLGRVRMLSRNPEGAEEAFLQAIELDPGDLAAYRVLGDLYHGAGRLDDAKELYQRAIKARPSQGWLYERLALLQEKTGDREGAIENYGRAVELDPRLALAKNNLSYLLTESGGDLDRALRLAREAKEQRPKDPGTADTLGWVLLKRGDTAEAITYLREAEQGWAKGNLSIGIVRHHLALAYEADGSPDKAAAVLDDALASLDRQTELARQDGREIQEPSWASDVRAMSERLKNQDGV